MKIAKFSCQIGQNCSENTKVFFYYLFEAFQTSFFALLAVAIVLFSSRKRHRIIVVVYDFSFCYIPIFLNRKHSIFQIGSRLTNQKYKIGEFPYVRIVVII